MFAFVTPSHQHLLMTLFPWLTYSATFLMEMVGYLGKLVGEILGCPFLCLSFTLISAAVDKVRVLSIS